MSCSLRNTGDNNGVGVGQRAVYGLIERDLRNFESRQCDPVVIDIVAVVGALEEICGIDGHLKTGCGICPLLQPAFRPLPRT